MAEVSGIILAGGRSSRMGQDKASLVMDGATLLQRTVSALEAVADEVVIVRAPGQSLPLVQPRGSLVVVEDAVEGEGPLYGMGTGLHAASAPVAVVVGVDHPFLQPDLLRLLADRVRGGARWVLPIADGRPQPLCSAFARDALEVIRTHLAAGDRAPMAVAADLGMVRLREEEWRHADPEGWSFVDVDTPEDFAAALARRRG
ncbi:MAG: molybdenum cofactor guanylyltransferase [Dehalococcoidia bacterium]|nr:molybdenum cofactor guanylyltransferase [Dehalococcoidia bacterium]